MGKRGLTLGNLRTIAVVLGVSIITISIMGQVLNKVQAQQSNTTTAYNITGKGLSAMSTFGDWFSILVIVSVAVIVIGLLTRAFGGGKRGA